ncbi:hypothetical protein ABPG74_006760 [Tetrahymena malaccensis]
MLTQQQVKLVESISKKRSKGQNISYFEFQTFILKMQQTNPFTQLQDYFNDQMKSFILKRTIREECDVAIKQIDCIYEYLKDSINIMKKYHELLICQKLFAKINHQNPSQIQNLDHFDYGAQSQLLKAEVSQEKREITSKKPNCSNEEVKHYIYSILKEYDNVNGYLSKVWFQLYLAQEYEEKKIGMLNMKKMLDEIIKNKNDQNQDVKKLLVIYTLDDLNYLHSNNTLHNGIKLKNVLIYGISRLYDFELVSDVGILRSYKSQFNRTKANFGNEVEKRFSQFQAHLYLLRLTILEFDNIDIIQRQLIKIEDLTENYQGKEIFSQFQIQLPQKSNIFKIFKVCLIPNYQKIKLAASLTYFLNNMQSNQIYLMIYSTLLLELIKEQAKIIWQYNNKKYEKKYKNRRFELSGIYTIFSVTRDIKIFQDIIAKISIAEDIAYSALDPSQIYNNIQTFLVQEVQKSKYFTEFANKNTKQNSSYLKMQQSKAPFNLAQSTRTKSELDQKMIQFTDLQYSKLNQKNNLKLKGSLDQYDQFMQNVENQSIQIKCEKPLSQLKNESDLINGMSTIYLSNYQKTQQLRSDNNSLQAKKITVFKNSDGFKLTLDQNKNTIYDVYVVLDKGLIYNKSDLLNIAYKSKSVSIQNISKNNKMLKNISQCQQNKLKNRLKSQQKANIINYLENIKTDFNYLKMKLLGGSEKQKKQDFDNHKINKKDLKNDQKIKLTQQIQFIQIQNEDKSQSQVGEQNNIQNNSLNEFEKQVNHKANSDKMIIDEQNDLTIHKKRKSQKINQSQKQNKSQNQIEEDISIKNKQLSEINEQEQYQEKKIIEDQDNQILNLQNKSNKEQFNQTDDRNCDRVEIQQNSSFQQQLFTQIQIIIDLYKSKQAVKKDLQIAQIANQIHQSDDQIKNDQSEVPQENVIQNENQHQNENQKIQLEDLITQTNRQKNLEEQDLNFIKSIFKLGNYINSGGEADIFVNIQQQVAFRVIKINDNPLTSNLSELQNIKQFQEEQSVLDLQTSHLIENKLNKQKYMIHVMQICQSNLVKEYNTTNEYSLGQILKITFTCLHFLIQLRQKYIYHSDIKLANILKINDQYKLSDFGASKTINVNNPYANADMYTEYYQPKNEFNKKLPFYHDIYSVAKTLEVLLKKLQTYGNIKKKLSEQIDKLLQDDKNSIKIDCFELPQKFIDCLLIDQIELETKNFLDKYLVKIEEYLIINKENKIFLYESQFQYAEIALKILKIENSNGENNYRNKIKFKALQTKSYILIKKGQYKEAYECIQEILNSKLYDKQDQQFEVCFDKDIQDVCLILVNLKEFFFFDQEQIKEIDKLIQKYKDIFGIQITLRNPLYYHEQYSYHHLKSIFRLKYEQITKLSHNKQNYQISADEFLNMTSYESQEMELNWRKRSLKYWKISGKVSEYQSIKS